MHGWPLAPFSTKDETDANYKRMLDVRPRSGQRPRRCASAWPATTCSSVAWAATRAERRRRRAPGRVRDARRHVSGRGRGRGGPVGRPPAVRPYWSKKATSRLPSPTWYAGSMRTAARRISCARQFSMTLGSTAWNEEAERFRGSVRLRHLAPPATNRIQDRSTRRPAGPSAHGFANEPDTDFTIAANRHWVDRAARMPCARPDSPNTGR